MSLVDLYIRMELGDTSVFNGLKPGERMTESPLVKAGATGLIPILITFGQSRMVRGVIDRVGRRPFR